MSFDNFIVSMVGEVIFTRLDCVMFALIGYGMGWAWFGGERR